MYKRHAASGPNFRSLVFTGQREEKTVLFSKNSTVNNNEISKRFSWRKKKKPLRKLLELSTKEKYIFMVCKNFIQPLTVYILQYSAKAIYRHASHHPTEFTLLAHTWKTLKAYSHTATQIEEYRLNKCTT